MINHDRLFKELLSTFFAEFIQSFLPKVFAYLEPDSITFLYLKLNAAEEQTFQAEIDKLGLTEREQVMEIVTSWMEQGIQQGEVSVVLRQLYRRLRQFAPYLTAQIRNLSIQQVEELGEALLDFSDEADLVNWLNQDW